MTFLSLNVEVYLTNDTRMSNKSTEQSAFESFEALLDKVVLVSMEYWWTLKEFGFATEFWLELVAK